MRKEGTYVGVCVELTYELGLMVSCCFPSLFRWSDSSCATYVRNVHWCISLPTSGHFLRVLFCLWSCLRYLLYWRRAMPTTSTHCGLHWSEFLQTVFSLLIFTLTCTYVLHTYIQHTHKLDTFQLIVCTVVL